MTESEWLTSADPAPLLRYLRESGASERKLRLFAVACCQRIWHLLNAEASQHVVQVAERYADAATTGDELHLAYAAAPERASYFPPSSADTANDAARATALRSASAAAFIVSATVARAVVFTLRDSKASPESAREGHVKERTAQKRILLEVFGNPFRPTVIDPLWQVWNDWTVRRIAQSIYDERAFDRMPILADALEDAGCDEADILSHCRGERLHVRGCHVLDALLGKE
jgi:hypothetical protein